MTPQLEIRELKRADTIQLQGLTQKNPLSAGFHWTSEKVLEEWKHAKAWGLWQDVKLSSFVLFRENPEAYEITTLATHPDFRRRGHMEKLLKDLFAAYRQKPWWLEVHEKNQGALSLYEKLGLVVTSKRPNYYPDGAAALLMSLEPT